MYKRLSPAMIKQAIKKMLGASLAQRVSSVLGRYHNAVIIDKRLIRDIADFDGITYAECLARLPTALASNAELWKQMSPHTPEEILDFYRRSPYYVYELAWWHMSRKQRAFRNYVVSLCAKDTVLDWGGGIGILAMQLAEKGSGVTYADVAGKTSDFAQWLFSRRQANVAVRIIGRDALDTYATIVCLETLEHVPDPRSTLVLLRQHLKSRGRLIVSGLEAGVDLSHPMHIARVSQEDLVACGFARIRDICWEKTD